MLNLHSEEDRIRAMVASSFAAVQLGFRHLALRDIIDPPPEYFDALLARHIAIHIMVAQFDIPKRRLVKVLGRSRGLVRFAAHNIDARLGEAHFQRSYRRMVRLAFHLFNLELQKAAA